jgi:hypothetical protein
VFSIKYPRSLRRQSVCVCVAYSFSPAPFLELSFELENTQNILVRMLDIFLCRRSDGFAPDD